MRQHGQFTRLLGEAGALDAASRTAARDYLRDLRTAKVSPNTIDNYEDALLQLHRWLAAHAPGATLLTAGREELSAYLIHVGEASSRGTLATRYRRLHRWYGWLVEEDLVGAHPMARVPRPRPEHKAPAVVTPAQLSALLATTGNWKRDVTEARDRAIIMLFCTPGSPRASEMAGMSTDDIDMGESDCILIRGKGAVERTIGVEDVTARVCSRYLLLRARLPRAAAEAAAARREGRREAAWLGKRGPMTRSGMLQMVRARGEQAGIAGLHPHQLRHTAFDACDNAGLQPRQAARLFGWASTRMCDVYGRAAAARRAVDAGRELGLVSSL